jgi:hypothetical protein
MPTDKQALLVENLGQICADISPANGYFNEVVAVDYGVTGYNNNDFASDQYPRIQIIVNNASIDTFSTKVASEVQLQITINAYLRKNFDVETDLESYKLTSSWSWDIRKAIKDWLAQMPSNIDGDLIDNQVQQTIGFPMNLLTCTTEFGIIFEECY